MPRIVRAGLAGKGKEIEDATVPGAGRICIGRNHVSPAVILISQSENFRVALTVEGVSVTLECLAIAREMDRETHG
jgi:hypothetical protein